MADNGDLDSVTLQYMLWNRWESHRGMNSDEISTDTTQVELLRGLADVAFARDDLLRASRHYQNAASILLNQRVLEIDSSKQDTRELVNLLSQQSECLFRLEQWLQAAQISEQVLCIDPNHVPSLYRHAISNWRGHVPGKDFAHIAFWASAAQSYDRLVQLLDCNYVLDPSRRSLAPSAAKQKQSIEQEEGTNQEEYHDENMDPLLRCTAAESSSKDATKRLPFKTRTNEIEQTLEIEKLGSRRRKKSGKKQKKSRNRSRGSSRRNRRKRVSFKEDVEYSPN